MRKANLFVSSLWAALGLMVPPDQAWSFDLETHRVMGQRAAQESGLDMVLKEQLGFGAGIAETFNGTQAEILIANGSRAEDSPFWRVRHHFHNPTRVWNDAGLRVLGIELGQSSVLWSQNPGQTLGGRHSWQAPAVRIVVASVV